MRSLSGDRFLRRFVGDLKNRRKRPNSEVIEQNPENDVEKNVGPGGQSAEAACEKEEEDNAEPTKKDETEPKNE